MVPLFYCMDWLVTLEQKGIKEKELHYGPRGYRGLDVSNNRDNQFGTRKVSREIIT